MEMGSDHFCFFTPLIVSHVFVTFVYTYCQKVFKSDTYVVNSRSFWHVGADTG